MSATAVAPPPPAPSPTRRRWPRAAVAFAVAGGLAAGAVTRDRWQPLLFPAGTPAPAADHAHVETAATESVTLSPAAQKNLGLTARPVRPETFWKTLSVPGIVTDRPGFGDRGVAAPVTGVVARIHRVAGDPARPGDVLFTLRILSESLHQTQADLFKAAQEMKLAEAQRARLAASAGAVAEARVTEAENQVTRLGVAAKAYRQELLTRGLLPDQIEAAAAGRFVSEITVPVPPLPADGGPGPGFEVEAVKVELGAQVQAGQTLCVLANHRLLAVEGRAFRDEAPLLERAAREGWPAAVDFGDEGDWPPLDRPFRVSYVANAIDPESRTFRFLLPLDNQARAADGDGHGHGPWRFRPGQRVRILLRVGKLDDVFVLPAAAVARDGAEAYVFRQNGDSFDRKPVQVVYQDRDSVVLANDGGVSSGVFVARGGAAQLNRMVKGRAGTVPAGFHIHADGSVHMGSH